MPYTFSRNGTFMAVRQLEQNVSLFDGALNQQAPLMQEWLDDLDDSPLLRNFQFWSMTRAIKSSPCKTCWALG